jgi:3-hydroxyisobutyrate dehydrogenase-like beta-hydroxyacid dehydrogenase
MTMHSKYSVTVLGLGPMGQAMVRALLAQGYPTTVWNRTPARAADVVAAGAKLASTPAGALAASELIILSLTDYQAMYDILGDSTQALAGKLLVNLSSDTPARSSEAFAWATSHGARFLTGGVMVPAPMVGTEASYVYYSGPRELLDAHEATLRIIGTPRYVGADPALAQLYYQAQLDVFLTTLSSLLHATALVGSAGVTAAAFIPEALGSLRLIDTMLTGPETARQIDDGVHPGTLSTTTMMGATAAHILNASEAAGIDLELPRAVKSHYDRAIRSGHGKDDWTSLIEIIKAKPRRPPVGQS